MPAACVPGWDADGMTEDDGIHWANPRHPYSLEITFAQCWLAICCTLSVALPDGLCGEWELSTSSVSNCG